MALLDVKAREHELAEASSGLRTNVRLGVVFGLLSALSLAFQAKTVGVLLAALAAVFTIKVGYYVPLDNHKTDLASVRRVVGSTDGFLGSFEDFKTTCRAEHPKLAEDIAPMQIVGIQLETEGRVFVYFSGPCGRLFMARYAGQWSPL